MYGSVRGAISDGRPYRDNHRRIGLSLIAAFTLTPGGTMRMLHSLPERVPAELEFSSSHRENEQ